LHVADIYRQIAEELGVREQQVEATVALLDGGATVPFVARYRKEITGSLDDAQLRTLEERLNYLREIEERRIVISIPSASRASWMPHWKRRFSRPIARVASKTSTFRSSRSAAPRPRSPKRRGWTR